METDATLIQGEKDPRADKFVAEMEELGGKLREARAVVGSVIFGQYDVVDQSLVTLLAGGHALLVGVPGLAKTRLVETLGQVLGLSALRPSTCPKVSTKRVLANPGTPTKSACPPASSVTRLWSTTSY